MRGLKLAADFLPGTGRAPSESPKSACQSKKNPLGSVLTSGGERSAAHASGKSQRWGWLGVGPGVGSRRGAGPTWAIGCASLALHSGGGSGPGLWLPSYLL